MNKHSLACLTALSVLSFSPTALVNAYDWDNVAIPAYAGDGKRWQLQPQYSDDFNYSGKNATFHSKWKDGYFNNWTGPGLTYWKKDHSNVAGGALVLRASRHGSDRVGTGVITSKTKVTYPIFMEARIKVSNLELSSNFWLLSDNDQREIDILEVYGGARDSWFAKNMSTNFHVFFRNSDNSIKSDYNDQTHNQSNGYWRDGYHRFGAYWKSPSDVTFYIDGKKTPDGSWAQAEMFDKDYTRTYLDKSRYNMNQSMFMILDMEDHEWRSRAGNVASDADLADNSKNRMYVDWVRTYKPVASGDGGPSGGTTLPPNDWTNLKMRHSAKCMDVAYGARTNGSTYHQWACNQNNVNQAFKFTSVGGGYYTIKSRVSNLCMDLSAGSSANGAKVQQWSCNSSNQNQHWKIVDKGDAWFELRSRKANKCLDVAGKSTKNGADYVHWACYNGHNQQFRFH
ncbi:RICIN domain-containing protein [Agaribacterium haliotis]|uniref:RICIN domain-containing protein n=1 Tax=Agaribacterium haliotis TaxID=2013869 RepID=UPI000BB5849C|nr:RICIN domain-containing protein [Agaribacterium haliotis]